MKKVLSVILAFVLTISILPIASINVKAATYDANVVVDLALSKVNTNFANGYCLRFVKEMFAGAYGFTSSACCAYKYGNSYIDSTSRNNIPLGASVFFAGSSKTCSTCGNKCGHIGIYVGNDYVVHGWGGKIVKYKIDRIINAGYPYRGWGWHGNVELSSDFPVETTPSNSTNPDDYSFPTRDIFYKSGSSVMTGNDVKWVQSVLYQLGYTIVVDGSFGPATRDVVKQFQSDYGLSVDGSVGPTTRTKLLERWNNKKNGNISISLHTWFSDAEFGDLPDKYVAGDRVYLCYELIESNTGERINSLVDKSYSATLTLYNPDGSVFHTNQVDSDDNSWISVVPREAGTYRGTISISGDVNVTGNVSFVLVYDALLNSSLSSFALNLNGTNTKTSTITVSGGYPGKYGARYSIENSSIASASWGDWNGNNIPITVTGKKTGTTNIVISLYENYTGNQNVVKTITIPISVVANNYTVSFNANGGSVSPSSKTVTYSSTYGTLPTPTRTGYSFAGWYTSSTGGTQVTSNTTVTTAANHTLYAHWSANPYTITYNANGGSGAPNNQTKYHGTNITLSSTVPTRSGYTFLGWSTSSTATSATYQPGSTFSSNANTTLYAVWKANNSSLGANTSNSAVISTGGETKYFTFTPSQFGIYVIYSTGNSDTKVYLYDANGAQIDFDDDSGENRNFRLEAVLDEGVKYTFAIKYYDSSATGTISFKFGRVYGVYYDANGGEGAPDHQLKDYGANLTLSSTVPTRNGYTFKGWSTSSTATSATYQPGGSFTINAPTTLYAVWEVKPTALSVNSTNSAVISTGGEMKYFTYTPTTSGTYVIYSTGSDDTKVYLYNASGTELGNNDDDGDGNNFRLECNLTAGTKYTFGVRYYNSSKTGTISFKFGNVYTITYNANGGSGTPTSQKKDYDTDIILSNTSPTKAGHTFLGWALGQNATNIAFQPGDAFSINYNATLYAVWETDTYTISYYANGGSGAPSSQTKTYGGSVLLSSTVPTRTGYTFLGWATSSTATDATYQPGDSFTANANTTLYAVWIANTYDVRYHANGGSGTMSNSNHTYGVSNALSLNLYTRSGYTFLGWATSNSATTVTYTNGQLVENLTATNNGTVVLYAVWSKNDVNLPSAYLDSTNDLSNVQTVTINMYDDEGVFAYYWGTDSTYTNNEYRKCSFIATNINTQKEVSEPGTYGITVVDVNGNVSATYIITFYKTTLNANGGNISTTSILTRSGSAITLPTPTRSGYTFLGWSTSSTATSAIYQPGENVYVTRDTTLYAVWEATLTGITVKTQPTKTSYWIGESLNTTGLTLTATYSDGSTKTVSSGFTTSGFSSTSAGTKTVTVTYEGKTTTFNVTVSASGIMSSDGETFATLAEAAVAVPEGSTLMLCKDVVGNTAIKKTLNLDLNGHNVYGTVNVAAGSTLYCFDSRTDDYTVDDGEGYGMITRVVGDVQGLPEESDAAEDGYLMISEDDGVSFHRVNLQLTAMTLRASQVGVYYKSVFAGDEIVAQNVSKFGVALSVYNVPAAGDKTSVYSWFEGFRAGVNGGDTNSTLLYGIMKSSSTAEKNAANAAMPIYGRAYILTNDGQYLFGAAMSRTLQEQVEAADAMWSQMTFLQQMELATMYQTYAEVMQSWTLPNLQAAVSPQAALVTRKEELIA